MAFRLSAVTILLLGIGACDRFTVNNYGGSKIELTISGAKPTAAGHHLELWARDGEHDVIRVVYGSASDMVTTPAGLAASQTVYAIVPAVSLEDPCMIDQNGNLVWKPEAQVGCGPNPPAGCDDATERKNQAKAVELRIHQLTDLQPTPLYALVAWDDNTEKNRPNLPPDGVQASTRLQACTSYWRGSPNAAYSGSPFQLTAPIHGTLFGMLDFTAIPPAPSQLLGGIQVLSDYKLANLRELWFTDTTAAAQALDPDQIDCVGHPDTCRGNLLLDGNVIGPDENGIFHLKLASPQPGVSGTAAVYVNLDGSDPVLF